MILWGVNQWPTWGVTVLNGKDSLVAACVFSLSFTNPLLWMTTKLTLPVLLLKRLTPRNIASSETSQRLLQKKTKASKLFTVPKSIIILFLSCAGILNLILRNWSSCNVYWNWGLTPIFVTFFGGGGEGDSEYQWGRGKGDSEYHAKRILGSGNDFRMVLVEEVYTICT